ncbi:hypothetical protein ACFL3T_04440 [Patescibacteria group bacterium]
MKQFNKSNLFGYSLPVWNLGLPPEKARPVEAKKAKEAKGPNELKAEFKKMNLLK